MFKLFSKKSSNRQSEKTIRTSDTTIQKAKPKNNPTQASQAAKQPKLTERFAAKAQKLFNKKENTNYQKKLDVSFTYDENQTELTRADQQATHRNNKVITKLFNTIVDEVDETIQTMSSENKNGAEIIDDIYKNPNIQKIIDYIADLETDEIRPAAIKKLDELINARLQFNEKKNISNKVIGIINSLKKPVQNHNTISTENTQKIIEQFKKQYRDNPKADSKQDLAVLVGIAKDIFKEDSSIKNFMNPFLTKYDHALIKEINSTISIIQQPKIQSQPQPRPLEPTKSSLSTFQSPQTPSQKKSITINLTKLRQQITKQFATPIQQFLQAFIQQMPSNQQAITTGNYVHALIHFLNEQQDQMPAVLKNGLNNFWQTMYQASGENKQVANQQLFELVIKETLLPALADMLNLNELNHWQGIYDQLAANPGQAKLEWVKSQNQLNTQSKLIPEQAAPVSSDSKLMAADEVVLEAVGKTVAPQAESMIQSAVLPDRALRKQILDQKRKDIQPKIAKQKETRRLAKEAEATRTAEASRIAQENRIKEAQAKITQRLGELVTHNEIHQMANMPAVNATVWDSDLKAGLQTIALAQIQKLEAYEKGGELNDDELKNIIQPLASDAINKHKDPMGNLSFMDDFLNRITWQNLMSETITKAGETNQMEKTSFVRESASKQVAENLSVFDQDNITKTGQFVKLVTDYANEKDQAAILKDIKEKFKESIQKEQADFKTKAFEERDINMLRTRLAEKTLEIGVKYVGMNTVLGEIKQLKNALLMLRRNNTIILQKLDIKKTEIGTTKSIAPAQIGAILASAILKEVIAGKIKFEPDQKKDDYIQDFINLYAPESKKPVEMTKKKNSQQDQGEST